MNEITIGFIIFLASIVTICCLCTEGCCCELCINENHTIDERANELGEVSKVSSPIHDNSNNVCIEI